MSEEKHAGGRPPKYKTVEELDKKIKEYFELKDKNNEVYTYTGLINHLEMTKTTFHDYIHKPEFTNSLKMAKQKIEEFLEINLYRSQGSVTGIIFNLKNNYGWKDKQEIDHTIKEYDIDIED